MSIHKFVYSLFVLNILLTVHPLDILAHQACNFVHLRTIEEDNGGPNEWAHTWGINIIYALDRNTPYGLPKIYADGKKIPFSTDAHSRPSYCKFGSGLGIFMPAVETTKWKTDPKGLPNVITLEYTNGYKCDIRINKKLYKPKSPSYRKKDGTTDYERFEYDLKRQLIYQQGGGIMPSYDEMKRRQHR